MNSVPWRKPVNKPYRQKTLQELREEIATARPHVFAKGAPHAIDNVARALRMISSRFGVAEANRAIVEFELDKLGWRPQQEEEPEVHIEQYEDPLDRVLREP